jgi:hypothetical protein
LNRFQFFLKINLIWLFFFIKPNRTKIITLLLFLIPLQLWNEWGKESEMVMMHEWRNKKIFTWFIYYFTFKHFDLDRLGLCEIKTKKCIVWRFLCLNF